MGRSPSGCAKISRNKYACLTALGEARMDRSALLPPGEVLEDAALSPESFGSAYAAASLGYAGAASIAGAWAMTGWATGAFLGVCTGVDGGGAAFFGFLDPKFRFIGIGSVDCRLRW